VPRAIVFQVIDAAHKIDSGETIDFDTESKMSENDTIVQSLQEGQELKSDFVTKSIMSYSQAVEIAKQIIKSKKSARVSVAKIISEIYQQKLSPLDLNS
jgi:exonuclease VII small subunit